jgi:hypothetical protein
MGSHSFYTTPPLISLCEMIMVTTRLGYPYNGISRHHERASSGQQDDRNACSGWTWSLAIMNLGHFVFACGGSHGGLGWVFSLLLTSIGGKGY